MRKRRGREKKKHAKFRRCLAIRKEGKIRHKIKEIRRLELLENLRRWHRPIKLGADNINYGLPFTGDEEK